MSLRTSSSGSLGLVSHNGGAEDRSVSRPGSVTGGPVYQSTAPPPPGTPAADAAALARQNQLSVNVDEVNLGAAAAVPTLMGPPAARVHHIQPVSMGHPPQVPPSPVNQVVPAGTGPLGLSALSLNSAQQQPPPPQMFMLHAVPLHDEILCFHRWIRDRAVNREPVLLCAINLVRDMCRAVFGPGGAEVHSYGSFASGLSLPTSDLDLVVRIPWKPHPPSSSASTTASATAGVSSTAAAPAGSSTAHSAEPTAVSAVNASSSATTNGSPTVSSPLVSPRSTAPEVHALQRLTTELAKQAWVTALIPVATARMPVIKFTATLQETEAGQYVAPSPHLRHPDSIRFVPVDITFDCERPPPAAAAAPQGMADADGKRLEPSAASHVASVTPGHMHTGLRSVRLLQIYMSEYPSMPPLVMVLKEYLREKDCHNTFTGGLGSYCLILMVVSYLHAVRYRYVGQVKPPPGSEFWRDPRPMAEQPRDEDNLGELLMGFLQFFTANFDYKCMGIRPMPVSREALMAGSTPSLDSAVNGSSAGSGIQSVPGSSKDILDTPSHRCFFGLSEPSKTLVLMDPIDHASNVGAGVFGIWKINSALLFARDVMQSHSSCTPLRRILDPHSMTTMTGGTGGAAPSAPTNRGSRPDGPAPHGYSVVLPARGPIPHGPGMGPAGNGHARGHGRPYPSFNQHVGHGAGHAGGRGAHKHRGPARGMET